VAKYMNIIQFYEKIE